MKAEFQNRAAVACVLIGTLLLNACATTGKSVGLGAAVGAGTGMAIGGIADPGQKGRYRTRNVIIGGAAGAITGMVAGELIHSANEKSRIEGFNEGRATAPPPIDPNAQPKLIPAQWRAEIIEAKRIGNRFIPRHVEYVITDPARWGDPQ